MDNYEKMKVADLKNELKTLGLPTDGKKSDLVARLNDHHKKTETQLLGHTGTEDVDDTSLEALEKNVLGEEPVASGGNNNPATVKPAIPAAPEAAVAAEPSVPTQPNLAVTKPNEQTSSTAETPIPSITGKISLKAVSEHSAEEEKKPLATTPEVDAKLARAKKFGLPTSTALSDKDKKDLRAARFGVGSGKSGNGSASIKASAPSTDPDSLKKRAERFGIAVNPTTGTASATGVSADKLKVRQERFGVVASTGGAGDSAKNGSSKIHITSPGEKEKMLKRKERFGPATTDAETEEKKMKRAERFEVKAS